MPSPQVDFRWINAEANTLEEKGAGTGVMGVKLDPTGNITSSAAGLAISVAWSRFRGIIDPTADGGTAALPTAGGADTTVASGTGLLAGDFYIVATSGAIGTINVPSGNKLLVANTDGPAAAGDWTIVDADDITTKADSARNVIAGAGLTGGGDLTADRTFDVGAGPGIVVNADDITIQPDTTTGGTTIPVAVSANGVGIDLGAVDHDQLLNFVANEHIDHTAVSVIAANGGVAAANNDLSANIGLSLDPSGLTALGAAPAAADEIIISDVSNTNSPRKVTVTELSGAIDHDSLLNFVANEHIDHSSVSVVAGGDDGLLFAQNDLTANIGLAVDIAGTTALGANADLTDEVLLGDASNAGALRKVTVAELTGNIQSRMTQVVTLAAGDIAAGITLSSAPAASTNVEMHIGGAPVQSNGTDFTIAGAVVSFSAALQAILVAGDVVQFVWN